MLKKKPLVAKKAVKAAPVVVTKKKVGTSKTTSSAKVLKSGKTAPVKTGAFGRPIVPGAKKAPARAKPKKFVFKAPADFRSTFVEVGFSTDKDGFMAPGATVEAIKGKWDNDNAPRYDLMVHDTDTAVALIGRINMLLYVPNQTKRLTPKKDFILLIRASVSKVKGNEIRAGIKMVWATNAKGKMALISDKKDLELRRIRRCGKFLAPAFQNALGPIELRDLDKAYQKSLEQEDEED